MKQNFLICFFLSVLLFSCKKEVKTYSNIEIEAIPESQILLTNLAADCYNPNVSTSDFKQKYPWFQGSVSDADFEAKRTDTLQINSYNEAIKKINQVELKKNLASLFGRIRYFFPEFKNPKVFLVSSVLEFETEPVLLSKEMMFIDVCGFLGENNKRYKGLETYYQKSMNSDNLIPKIAFAIANDLFRAQVTPVVTPNKFIDMLLNEGKTQTMMDAFLPTTPDYLKFNFSKAQFDWCQSNEENIWNYFVENNLIFSDDVDLYTRFIEIAPFSKFYTEIDRESSPQVGRFTGWKIAKKYLSEYPEIPLRDFLKISASKIFNESYYKPKN